MKKLIIKFISLVLILILSALMMFSCKLIENLFDFDLVYRGDPNGIYPDGYTGGYGINGQSGEEIWWVETYEEYLAATEQLKAHGCNLTHKALFVYEGDAFDIKYCFWYNGKKDEIKYGDNPFDRYVEEAYVTSIVFFDDVTLDEINYSLVRDYHSYCFAIYDYYRDHHQDILFDYVFITDWERSDFGYIKRVYYENELIFHVSSCFDCEDVALLETQMTDELILEMLTSGVKIR